MGNIGRFAIEAHHRLVDRSTSFSVRFDGVTDADAGWSDDPVGLARKLEHAMRAPERRLDFYRSERARLEKSADAARKSLAEVKDFAQAEELAQMDEKIASIEAELLADAEKEQDAAKESSFGDDRPVVATLTGDELGEWSDIRDLSRKAFNWYRQNLVGTTTIMEGTGWSVGYTRRGAGKISGRKGEDLLRMVPAIPAIIERGQHVSTEQNRKDDGVKAYHKVAARVELDGRLKDVIVTVREMHNGKFHYDLSRDNSEGALFQRIGDQSEMNVAGSRPSSPILEVGARAASPASFNIEISETEINGDPPLTPARAREINAAARAELEKVGIAGRVRAEAGGSGNATGTYQRGVIRIIRERGKGWRHTLDHEIIHALRDPQMWAGDHGVFSAEEWRALARAASADRDTRARIEAIYLDLFDGRADRGNGCGTLCRLGAGAPRPSARRWGSGLRSHTLLLPRRCIRAAGRRFQ